MKSQAHQDDKFRIGHWWPLRSLTLLLLLVTASQTSTFALDYSQATVETLAVSSTNDAGFPIDYPYDGTPEVMGWFKHLVPLYAYIVPVCSIAKLCYAPKPES
ncbi:MAG TPA: hypothetical protein ENL01_01305 [Chlorobaculum parvum]|uniref:Uncharacterized protein n=1 Tax=Chlorobaculum parvum TaxID=274539 RepID=A0A7C5H9Q8_9CHLB|nr:hypothetical protein [Chlorobaculum parvum]